jgi:hypothetical protein
VVGPSWLSPGTVQHATETGCRWPRTILTCPFCHFAALCVQLPRTAAELNAYAKGVVEAHAPAAEAGWRTVDVDVAGYPGPVKLRVYDAAKWLRELCQRPDLQTKLHLDGAELWVGGERCWKDPWQCDAFLASQAAVRARHGPDAKVIGIQVRCTVCVCEGGRRGGREGEQVTVCAHSHDEQQHVLLMCVCVGSCIKL